jgi:hypothetical protein
MEVIHTVNITDAAVFDYEYCLIDPPYKVSWKHCIRAAKGNRAKAFEIAERFDEPLIKLDQRKLKTEVGEYIGYLYSAGRIPWWGYFRADYEDDATGEQLKLFIKKGQSFRLMQNWDIVGICKAEDWTEDDEYDGRIRAWYTSEYYGQEQEVPKDCYDWAVAARVHKLIQNTEKTLFKNVLQEVVNEFDNETDKRDAEQMAFLQSVYFEIRGRRKPKKNNRANRGND